MGTDIHGWVEVHGDSELEPEWYGILHASMLLERTYEVFAFLFGVQNHYGFQPIAANRGLPLNVSNIINRESSQPFWEHTHSHSWANYTEVQQIALVLESDSDGLELEGTGWGRLIEIMRLLADQFGEQNLRLVVWFTD